MADPRLSELLKWSVQNSAVSRESNPSDDQSQPAQPSTHGLTAETLAALLGGPSDADLMRESMAAITSKELDLDNRLIAFDNFEQLVENIDNANNMEPLGLWMPLVAQLSDDEPEIRRMAAWCVGSAVQNNVKAQERLLIVGAIPTLIKLAINDSSEPVRKKAILALSSGIRNYQPGLDAAQAALPEEHKIDQKLDAGDMGSVDVLIQKLRDQLKQAA